MQPWKAAGEKRDGEMTHYQQTLIIPRTKQRFPAEPRRDGRRAYRPRTGNNINRELNSIMAFFD